MKVLYRFGALFSSSDPFRPVSIRAIHDDPDKNTVLVMWTVWHCRHTVTRTVGINAW
jgi:hypothetical protein